MSHVSQIQLEITSLDDLKVACATLGFTFKTNQETYAWYGRWVGDAPLPEGIDQKDLGTCNHAITVPGCSYEIGVVKRGEKYLLLWDSWHRGGLEQKIGKDAGLLKQAYTIERIRREAKLKRYRVQEIRKDTSVRLVLRV